MTRVKRWLLWGLILSPVALVPTVFVFSRMWLNQHLQRELAFGEFRLRLGNPYLAWNLDFHTDSVEVDAPRFSLRTGSISTDVRLWNSIASLKPSVRFFADTVRIRVQPESLDSAEREKRRKKKRKPSFPNIRIPVEFKIRAARVDLAVGDRDAARVRGLTIMSQGPKGAAVEASGLALRNPRDSASLLELDAGFRVSARWFGKFVRYQLRVQNKNGDFIHEDGERRKSDLRVGKDSLEARWADLHILAPLFSVKGPPAFTGMEIGASLETGKTNSMRLRTSFTTPRVWQIGPQRVELKGNVEETSGRLTLSGRGQTGEELYLQGQFQLPGLDSGFARVSKELTATLSGYTRNLRFKIGRRMLPGDAEIRRLKILPGLVMEADARTRDNSEFRGRAFRAPDSSSPGDSAWKCVFSGTVDPGEAWVHAWVDTNVTFRTGRVSAEAGRNGLEIEAWLTQARAYGAAADSVYTVQHINKTGYYLTGSRVHLKDVMWPVIGQVEWGRRPPGNSRRKRNVSLAFRTKHPRYGSAEFSMPRARAMAVRVEKLDCQHLPYMRMQKLLAMKPLVTGAFEWDWLAQDGKIDADAAMSYNGLSLDLGARSDWDASRFRVQGLDVSIAGSKLHFSGGIRLDGKQFWQMRGMGFDEVESLAMVAEDFDAARLGVFLGPGYPVESGNLNGRLSYTDGEGFRGHYGVRGLVLTPLRKFMTIPRLDLSGQGESLLLSMRTESSAYPWFNDSILFKVDKALGETRGLSLNVFSNDGLNLAFRGSSREFKDLDGKLSVSGKAALPGQAGMIRDVRVGGRIRTALAKDFLKTMVLDSGSFAGRYAVPGLDTQSFSGTMSLAEGRLRVPDLKASNESGVTLTGEADCEFAGAPKMTARIRGKEVALQWPGIQKLVLRDADASLRADSTGLVANAVVGKVDFASSKPPVSMRGTLEDLKLEYDQPSAPKAFKGVQVVAAGTPQLRANAKLRDFIFKHKIGFRQLQRNIRTVKTDKRKKRAKPVDLQLNLETVGSGNRVDTDVLRMVFVGDVSVKGVYPYTLLSGEFSALSGGELGQTSQSYDISDFDLKWQNATVEEGSLSVEGGKRLRSDCKPDTKRTCNVYVKLAGRLDEMAFTYDSDCGANTGETLEPSALINSVSRGCWSDEYVAGGAGGGNYGEAVVSLLEPTINEKLTSVGTLFSGGWIKRTSVSGIGSAVTRDTTGGEPIAIGVESKEKWGMSVKAQAGYYPEKKVSNPWENKVAVEWRPPLEKASQSSKWKRRVRDRVTLEASAETRPDEENLKEQKNQDVRTQVGVRYRFKFWNLW